MPLVIADRVRETTTTSGTGTISLSGPYSGFQAFSVIGNGNTTYYAIIDAQNGAWEVGIGAYTSSGNTLSRATVLSSSNAGSLVNFGTGTKDVILTQPARRSVLVQEGGSGLITGVAAFTANGVPYADSTSTLATSPNLTFNGTRLTVADLADSGLTAGRVVYAGSGGSLTDSANLLYSGTDLTVYGLTVGRGAGAVAQNTAVGFQSLLSNTTGQYNTATGYNSLVFNTTGNYNVALGYNTGFSNTTGSYNTALGTQALSSNTTASQNTAVGSQAGYSNTTGQITAVGAAALYANTTGVSNVAVGGYTGGAVNPSLRFNTTGSYNTAVGDGSLGSNTTASYNTAVGYQAAYNTTTGQENSAFGQGALFSNTTANNNSAFGSNVLRLNTTGTRNSAFGWVSMYNNTTGSNNTAFGTEALPANTTGDNNTAVGVSSLFSNTTGQLNTALGMYALRLNVAGTRNTAVGYNALQAYTASGQADNVAVGLNAMNAFASGTANTAVGNYALGSNATASGSANSALGTYALQALTSGSSNTAVGLQAGYSLTTGSRNVMIGRNSAFGLSSGSENTVIGPDNGSSVGVGAALSSGSTNTLIGVNAGVTTTTGSYNTIVGGYNNPSATTDYTVALADGTGNARFLFLNNTSTEARYPSAQTNLSYVSANLAGLLRHRGIPILGNPNGGTHRGYLILAKAYDGVVGQALSNVLGRFWFVRGGTGSGNRSSLLDVNCATAFSVSTVGISGQDQGDFAQRIVTCTYDSEQWLALETSLTGGQPDGGVFFEGTFQDAGMVYVDATYVSSISEFNSSVGLNVNNFGGSLVLNSGQITFPATQNASSNANTLDDYEEGTWSPVIKFGATTATQTSSSASYTKVGRVVTLMVEAYITNLNGGTGGFSLSGFPFNAYSFNRQTEAQFYFQFMSATFPAGDKMAYILPNDSSFGVNYFTGASGTSVSLDNTHFTTSSYFYAQITYFAP